MKKDFTYREIPYNYTSFSDREIIVKYFDEQTWDILNALRQRRVTGRSAKLLFEIIGDMFIIDRNPYIFNDFLENPAKQRKLQRLHRIRLDAIRNGAKEELVPELIDKVSGVDRRFFERFRQERHRRSSLVSILGSATSPQNIHFSAFHKVTHVTDATDWRFDYPETVVYPDTVGEIIKLVKASRNAGLKIIPRGGGTGLTGGAVPVHPNTMVINTEKLREIGGIEIVHENGLEIPVVEVQAGVITDAVTHYCKEQGYIFATDPTSAWASTIGGNISENAGGKKAVMWGTAIDNLFSFRIVNARGELLEVKRRNHPHRKINPDDTVIFDVYTRPKGEAEIFLSSITLLGTDIRKSGIGKDITNKALNGLPGIQKEGGDGVIVSARFVLYKPFAHVATICVEFYGDNLINAARAIVDIKNHFGTLPGTFLTALEHFDEKYVAAINYRNKSSRTDLPKAVLLIDVESNDSDGLGKAGAKIIEIVSGYQAEGFIAENEQKREQFWKDRKNLGAIARHTNAFKLNEDVVIPIESLPSFADYVELLNLSKELKNNLAIISDIRTFIEKISEMDDAFIDSKILLYLGRLTEVENRTALYMQGINRPAGEVINVEPMRHEKRTIGTLMREGIVNYDIAKEVIDYFLQVFHGYDEMIADFRDLVSERRLRKIIVATHMHAGDGNIHVNIPVLSNDYAMLREADDTAGEIMRKTVELGGVISGEHGIGLTKLRFIDQKILDEYARYKRESDPDDLFNPGKLSSNFPLSMVYTPSLNLLKLEAFILEAVDLKDLTTSIAACVRCGKCKEVCNTTYPGGNMFYSPRNKILAVSLITEAVLYEAQTAPTLTLHNFKMLKDISNHCTMCHNCYEPCPVNIDFGEVTLSIKTLLVDRKRTRLKLLTAVTLGYLRRRGYYANKLLRLLILQGAFTAQRFAYYCNKPVSWITSRVLGGITPHLAKKFPHAGGKTVREFLKLKGTNTFFAFMKPSLTPRKSVVYFPGCGSERMFPDISMATLALLYDAGIRVVIPPEYLCCGYPSLFNGKVNQAENKSYENRVILHRMEATIGYMNIEQVIVSCGTCFEMLSKYQIDNIFPGASIIDISEFLVREKLYPDLAAPASLLYHTPCHSPLKKEGPEKVYRALFNAQPVIIPHCCGEGGTLSLSTPEITNILQQRKQADVAAQAPLRKAQVITSCPSCVQGLSKIAEGTHLAVVIAELALGKHWKRNFLRNVRKENGMEKIIF